MSALVLDALTKTFGTVRAVDGFSLTVPSGGRTAIVGASGSGKTTVLRMVAGFEIPDAGTIRLDGALVSDASGALVPAHQRGIGYVPQDGALFPHLSVGQNVAFGLTRAERTPARIAELLAMVSLDPAMARRRPDQLSGGQQQRVALARALAVRPGIMLLDEPFSSLDAELRAETRAAVTRVLGDAGVTAILVTHDAEDARVFAQDVAVMSAGCLIASGTPAVIFGSAVAE